MSRRRFVTLGALATTAAVAMVSTLMASSASAAESAESLEARTIHCHKNLQDADLINRRIALSKPGDELLFDGTCLINKTIDLLGSRAYRGGSREGTVFQQADGANLDAIFASDTYLNNDPKTGLPITLSSLTIDGNTEKNPTAHDSIVIRSWQSTIQDIAIWGSGRDGIRLTSVSQNGTKLENTQVNGRIMNNEIMDSGRSGVYVEDPVNSCTDWHLENNNIGGTGADGVHMENAAGWNIAGNHIYGVGGAYGLYAKRLWGTGISDSYIENFGKVGLFAVLQGGAASTISNNRIFNFESTNPTDTFLHVEGAYDTGDATVTSNAIRGNGTGVGLDYQLGGATSLRIVSSGNSVTDVATPKQVGAGVTVTQGEFAKLGGL